MRKKLVSIIFVVLLAIVVSGCSGEKNLNQNNGTPSASPTVSEVSPSKSPEGNVSSQADAYYLVFKDLFEKDAGLNDGIENLALDLSAVKSEDTDSIIALFETFCANNDLTLLLDTYDGLTEKGYIKNMFFEKGLLIRFEDKSVTESEVVTDASKWRSGDGADGASYTVTFKNGTWEISDISGAWIS